ncbi:MAG: hypothetical protein GY941_24595 [Planctomycetes bacterium]|nr:hypothetical protein [Planctomycetota bacterium]
MSEFEEKVESLKKYVADNELRKQYSNMHFDVEADVYFFPTSEGGRHTPSIIGYRPGHIVDEDIMTTGLHFYVDQDYLFPGHQAKTLIRFISPEHYPNCLWVGKKVMIHEGAHPVGYAKINSIMNKILERES